MTRPRTPAFCLAALLVSTVAAALPARAEGPKPGSTAMTVYVGTYTGPKSKGIYMMTFDAATGALGAPEVAGEAKSPSFLTVSPDDKHLYAIGEISEFQGKKGGAVSAFSIDPATGKLTLINQQSTGGPGPCYVSLDHTGKVALVANYGGGSVESLPIKDDGSLGEPATFIQHTGNGPDKSRQKEPHAHSINVTPDNKYAIAADLGLDKLLIYKLDTATGKLTPSDPAFAATPPAGGPRHLAWHPNGKFAFVCNEMGMIVTTFAYDGEKGTLTDLGSAPTLPEGADRKGASTAEVQVHPNGKFVYVSNRGHDTIAVFACDPTTGKLTPTGHASSGGKTPRNFRIDPTGQFLFAANQDTGNIVVLKIDQATGALAPTGTTVEVSAPVCIKFVPRVGR
jgi:6-phosphogluconolactonase